MERDTHLAMISDYIVLAFADDKVTQSEFEFILRLAERMNVSEKDVVELFENPKPSKPLFSELERITHFYKLVLLMNIDMEAHEKEIIAVRNFGLKMGIRPGVIDQVLLKMDQFNDKIIPSEELIKIFQTYYN
ncbi:TerB family tellurite resistance protein [Ulvibacter antarcticus]|uniref:Tellurite resistance protein TerB n=1 Tax=Ulvibacter antarcticus TaxID=442714 RepID=A0A3L9YCT3_9FLAO|nr:TerB family tellurite resistance protein [Ulvibacter antarcticus]RMA58543.1 hypothetical protein BXY75_1916 [Ulvibacter antarcticus]